MSESFATDQSEEKMSRLWLVNRTIENIGSVKWSASTMQTAVGSSVHGEEIVRATVTDRQHGRARWVEGNRHSLTRLRSAERICVWLDFVLCEKKRVTVGLTTLKVRIHTHTYTHNTKTRGEKKKNECAGHARDDSHKYCYCPLSIGNEDRGPLSRQFSRSCTSVAYCV